MPQGLLSRWRTKRDSAFRYSLPDGLRVYAIGDVHGRLDCLLDLEHRLRLHRRYASPVAEEYVVFLGDYIDRGPDSRGVVEHLLGRRFADVPARFLMGNHEDALLRFLHEPEIGVDWFRFGGLATLASYGTRDHGGSERARLVALQHAFRELLPPDHLEFYRTLELSILLGDFLFVHAGVRPGVPLDRQRRSDLLEIREPFLSDGRRFPWRVVHGHTIMAEPKIDENKISLDTGAYATGKLSCAIIEGDMATLLDA